MRGETYPHLGGGVVYGRNQADVAAETRSWELFPEQEGAPLLHALTTDAARRIFREGFLAGVAWEEKREREFRQQFEDLKQQLTQAAERFRVY